MSMEVTAERVLQAEINLGGGANPCVMISLAVQHLLIACYSILY